MPEELLARLKNLEDSYYGDREAARQQSFFDTYGSRWSNNRGLGLAILNELDRRNIDTSAADEAVTEILDQLRTECSEILNMIKESQEKAEETIEKVETIQEVVSDQLAGDTEATLPPDTGEPPAPPADDETIDGLSEGIEGDAEGDVGDDIDLDSITPPPAPGAEGGQEPAPLSPPEPDEDEGEEELPPNEVESDARMKRIERMKSSWGKTRAQKKKESEKAEKPKDKPSDKKDDKATYWTPAAELIAAANGGR